MKSDNQRENAVDEAGNEEEERLAEDQVGQAEYEDAEGGHCQSRVQTEPNHSRTHNSRTFSFFVVSILATVQHIPKF